MTITIKNRYTGSIIRVVDAGSLSGANLSDANLSDANLSDANLSYADLSYADLSRADLSYANLSDANLSGANLSDANLSRANLSRANLSYADLSRANLSGAREDFRSVLDLAPAEAPGLLLAIREGRIDGSHYEGDCCCLVGTIANLRECRYDRIDGVTPNSSRPSERLFMGISPGHVPAINPVAKIVEGWIMEWQAERAQVTT